MDRLDGEHALGDHRVERREDGVDAFGAVGDLDDDRQVLGEAQDAVGVQAAVGSEALDPAQDRGAGQPVLAQGLDDRLVQRLVTVVVGLADEDPQQLAVAPRPS